MTKSTFVRLPSDDKIPSLLNGKPVRVAATAAQMKQLAATTSRNRWATGGYDEYHWQAPFATGVDLRFAGQGGRDCPC